MQGSDARPAFQKLVEHGKGPRSHGANPSRVNGVLQRARTRKGWVDSRPPPSMSPQCHENCFENVQFRDRYCQWIFFQSRMSGSFRIFDLKIKSSKMELHQIVTSSLLAIALNLLTTLYLHRLTLMKFEDSRQTHSYSVFIFSLKGPRISHGSVLVLTQSCRASTMAPRAQGASGLLAHPRHPPPRRAPREQAATCRIAATIALKVSPKTKR